MKLKIKKFNPAKLTPYATVMCIGKRGTGKTTLLSALRQILHQNHAPHVGTRRFWYCYVRH